MDKEQKDDKESCCGKKCCCCKSVLALVLLLIGGLIGYGVGHCRRGAMCPMGMSAPMAPPTK